MKLFITAIAMMLSLNLWAATENYKIKSIWKNKDAPAGKTYLATVTRTGRASDASDWLVIFGTKNNKVVKRAFNFGGMSFYTYEGASNSGTDDFYKMTYVIKNEQLVVTLTPRRGYGKSYTVIYSKYESAGSQRFAKQIVKEVMTEQDRLRESKSLTTLKDFKDRMDLISWDYGFSGFYEDEEFPLPVYMLQIEFYFSETMANKKFAKINIKEDGSDLLSQKFKEGANWIEDSDLALSLVEEEIERGLSNPDWDYEVGTYSSFSKKTSKLQNKVMRDAAKQFVKYEITNATGFECEDGIYTWEAVTWVLIDGSSYTYQPGTECD